jgi:hypothetical protein
LAALFPSREIYLVKRRDIPLSEIARKFYEFALKYYQHRHGTTAKFVPMNQSSPHEKRVSRSNRQDFFGSFSPLMQFFPASGGILHVTRAVGATYTSGPFRAVCCCITDRIFGKIRKFMQPEDFKHAKLSTD